MQTEIQILFTERSSIKLAFNTTWYTEKSDKVLRAKVFKIASDPKYDGYQRGLASMVYKFINKKSSGSGVYTDPNYQLANELQSQIIRTFQRRRAYYSFRDNIWGVDLADMQP